MSRFGVGILNTYGSRWIILGRWVGRKVICR
jgi:hypothetical protein